MRPSIKAIINALGAKDQSLQLHSLRTADVAVHIGRALRLNMIIPLRDIYNAALLHDVGKLYISSSILNKPESLTEREWEAVKLHPAWGHKFLSDIDDVRQYAELVLQHHEKHDGTGYPYKLTSKEILPLARVINIADQFSAATEDRPYRKCLPSFEGIWLGLEPDTSGFFGDSSNILKEVLVEYYERLSHRRVYAKEAASSCCDGTVPLSFVA